MHNIVSTQGFGTDLNDMFRLFVFIFLDIQYLANQKRKPMQKHTLMRLFSSPIQDFWISNTKDTNSERGKATSEKGKR